MNSSPTRASTRSRAVALCHGGETDVFEDLRQPPAQLGRDCHVVRPVFAVARIGVEECDRSERALTERERHRDRGPPGQRVEVLEMYGVERAGAAVVVGDARDVVDVVVAHHPAGGVVVPAAWQLREECAQPSLGGGLAMRDRAEAIARLRCREMHDAGVCERGYRQPCDALERFLIPEFERVQTTRRGEQTDLLFGALAFGDVDDERAQTLRSALRESGRLDRRRAPLHREDADEPMVLVVRFRVVRPVTSSSTTGSPVSRTFSTNGCARAQMLGSASAMRRPVSASGANPNSAANGSLTRVTVPSSSKKANAAGACASSVSSRATVAASSFASVSADASRRAWRARSSARGDRARGDHTDADAGGD